MEATKTIKMSSAPRWSSPKDMPFLSYYSPALKVGDVIAQFLDFPELPNSYGADIYRIKEIQVRNFICEPVDYYGRVAGRERVTIPKKFYHPDKPERKSGYIEKVVVVRPFVYCSVEGCNELSDTNAILINDIGCRVELCEDCFTKMEKRNFIHEY